MFTIERPEHRSPADRRPPPRRHPHRRAVVGVVALVVVLGGCGSGSQTTRAAPTSTSPPGPNPTTPGLEVVEGPVTFDADPACVALVLDDGESLDLRFDGYARRGDGDAAVLVDDRGEEVASAGDVIVVSGFRRGRERECGQEFRVTTVVSVNPP